MALGFGLSLPALEGRGGAFALGPELLSNPDFTTDTVWTKGTGWTISGGAASILTPGATSKLSQPVAFITGRTYVMTIVVSSMTTAGFTIRGYLAAAPAFTFGAIIGAAGTYTRTRLVTAADEFSIDGSAAAVASVESVSLRLVL